MHVAITNGPQRRNPGAMMEVVHVPKEVYSAKPFLLFRFSFGTHTSDSRMAD